MKVGMLLNEYSLKDNQATTYLIKKISSYVDYIYIFSVKSKISESSVRALELNFNIELNNDINLCLSSLEEVKISLTDLDLIFIRTNPARDVVNLKFHEVMLKQLEKIEVNGTPIINSPRALMKMYSKKYLLSLPNKMIPKTELINNSLDLKKMFNEYKKIVVKPLVGTRGQGVKQIDNFEDLVKLEVEYPLIAQEFVKGFEQADKRVCLLDGDILSIDGISGVVKRVPAKGEFRSNVFLGGTALPCELDEADLTTICEIKPWLRENNLRYVGLDLLGGKIIEINCFSPGGIQDYERFYNHPFGDYLVGSLLEDL